VVQNARDEKVGKLYKESARKNDRGGVRERKRGLLTFDADNAGQARLDVCLVGAKVGEASTHGLANGIDPVEKNAGDELCSRIPVGFGSSWSSCTSDCWCGPSRSR
jgi:hypothetical protein